MKKKTLYSLLLTTLMTADIAMSLPVEPNPNEVTTIPRVKKVIIYKKPELTVRFDTINVSDDNFDHIRTSAAGGVFLSGTNTVIVYHFNADSNNPRIINYCNYNNEQRQLVLRHELEHARKADFTRNTDNFSPFGRAEVAAMNEIMAPASEIIEALDYHAKNGHPYPNPKRFVARADSAITQKMGPFWPSYVSYNYQPVADAIITYALESFEGSVNRGFYKYTINKAYNRQPNPSKYVVNTTNLFLFNPDRHAWDPLWDFESDASQCNPYKYASWSVRQQLLEKVDSIVCASVGIENRGTYLTRALSR